MNNIHECKICGGNIIPNSDGITGVCESCGAATVIPKKDTNSSKINRANYLRRSNEFDKAISLFEEIVKENPEDSEAYWGLVLCKYGIEYVDDTDGSKKPTCHRTMETSILNDADYKSALENSVGAVHYLYEEEAEIIDEIQKRIKAIAANEKPYDIFICYKESDDLGQRTHDSIDVQDIYGRLTNKDYKVFYARKTLQNKLGEEYEPIIYAALSSAKIMLVYGSQPDFFNAVWVKNEWSRFRRMIKDNPDKKIIPIYDGSKMTAYDLPNELADFQAFDKYRVGFLEDLIEGLEKMLTAEKAPATKPVESASPQVNGTLQRAFLFLEDSNWTDANNYFEKVLDETPMEPLAYLGKLMVELELTHRDEFDTLAVDISTSPNYGKMIRFADESTKKTFESYKNTGLYNIALNQYNLLQQNHIRQTADVWEKIATLFKNLGNFKDSAQKAAFCTEKSNDLLYSMYCVQMERCTNNITLVELSKAFERLGDYKDSAQKAALCKEKANELVYSQCCTQIERTIDTNVLIELSKAFEKLGDYKDSAQKAALCKEKANESVYSQYYTQMEQTTDTNTLVELSKAFEKLGDYKDSQAKKAQCLEKAYTLALSHKNKGIENNNISETEVAATLFEILGNYADSNAQLEECMALKEIIRQNVAKMEKMAKQKFQKRIIAFSCTVVLLIVGYFIVKYRKYTQAISLYNEGKYIDAAEQLRALPKVFLKKNAYLTDIANEYSNIISTGNAHTVGLKSDGTVVAVGDNEYEQCNVTDWNDIVAVSAGRYHTVGLKSDGTVVAMGNNNGGQCNVTDWNDIVAVSAGKYNTVGLKSDGTVIATGYYGNDVTDWNNIVAVSAGGSHIVGLKSDGTVVAVSYSNGKCDLTGWNDIVAVSAGEDHIVGLKSDGTVVAMGDNNDDVTGWNDIVAVSAGNGHTVGLKSNSTVVAAGYNYSGQCDVTDWTDIVAVSACWYRTVGLKSDGTVVSVGSRQCDVTGWQLSTQPHIANP